MSSDELDTLTTDLPAGRLTAKDVLVVNQRGSKIARTGRWVVPKRIELRIQLCQVTLDFTAAVITSSTLRVDMEMRHSKLFIISTPDIEIDTDELTLTFSKLKLRPENASTAPRFHIELTGTLTYAQVIERRP